MVTLLSPEGILRVLVIVTTVFIVGTTYLRWQTFSRNTRFGYIGICLALILNSVNSGALLLGEPPSVPVQLSIYGLCMVFSLIGFAFYVRDARNRFTTPNDS